jgi:hypothetical protein
LLLLPVHIHAKKDAQITFGLRFERCTYVKKAKEIIFLMQLLSYENSSGINKNHRNNVLTVATGIADVISAVASVTWSHSC